MNKDSKQKWRTGIAAIFTLVWPLVLIRLGNWLLFSVVFGEKPWGRPLMLDDGYFIKHFIFIGLVVLCISWLFHQNYRGKKMTFLLLPIVYLLVLCPPLESLIDYPYMHNIFTWGFWYNNMLHHVMFFSYVIALGKAVIGTIKQGGKS